MLLFEREISFEKEKYVLLIRRIARIFSQILRAISQVRIFLLFQNVTHSPYQWMCSLSLVFQRGDLNERCSFFGGGEGGEKENSANISMRVENIFIVTILCHFLPLPSLSFLLLCQSLYQLIPRLNCASSREILLVNGQGEARG